MSWQMKAVALYLRLTRKRVYATADGGAVRLSAPKDSPVPPPSLHRRCSVMRRSVEGFDVYVVRRTLGDARSAGTVVYLHGGAFAGEIQKQHWAFIGELADHVGLDVQVPIYGLAPKHHAPEALRLITALLEESSSTGPVYLIGDSAGGGLALSVTQSWLADGHPPPRGVTVIAPWLDLALRNPAIADVEPVDPWLSRPGLAVCADAWADGISMDDPRVSPLFGDFTDFPPIDLYVGDRDITVADCRALRTKVPAIRYHEEPGAVHVYPLLPTPEGRAARTAVFEHISSRMR